MRMIFDMRSLFSILLLLALGLTSLNASAEEPCPPLLGIASGVSNECGAGSEGDDISGAGLFVAKSDGGNSDETNSGNSGIGSPADCSQHFASPCAELFSPSPALGQDIFLAEGGVWEDQTITITQDGSRGDPLVVSCYYNNGGTPNQCTSF